MKKLFTLLTLLVAIVTGAWAADEVVTIGSHNSGAFTISGTSHDVAGYSSGTNSATITPASDGQTASAGSKMNVTTNIGSKLSGKAHIRFTVSAGETVRLYIYWGSNSKSATFRTSDYTQSDNYYHEGIEVSSATKNTLQFVDFTFADAGTYAISAVSGDNPYMAAIKFTAAVPAGPTIDVQPQSAAYAAGQTIAALTVEATASSGTLTYQWYSCDDANKTNAKAISGAESASYTPTAAGFYYVKVTDGNGSVESDVAQITISAAEAPTISVSGAPAEAVKVGAEVILTATATGTPTPTITWYDNAQNAQPVETGATFTVPTDNAGTYQYYAVASNGVGTDAQSALQTIVVKEQVATPTITPNGAYFEESQEVTIACTDADATIQYSTDGGTTWNNYTEALTFTATTTLQAKAVKEGSIDSEIASATFNLVTLVEQTNVTGAATWDWSKFGTKEIKLTDETTPKKSEFFVLQNAVNYGLCSTISNDFGDAQALNVQTEYIVRDQKYFQGGYVKFNTTVPGTVTVKYTNTGNRSNEDDRRFLNVNGVNYGEGTMSSKEADAVTTTTGTLASGEITIKGTLKKDGSDQYLRIYTITFTPTPTVAVEISAAKAASFSSTQALDFSAVEGITAYKATMKTDNYVHLDEVETVPAEAGIIVKGAEGTYDVPVATGDVAELSDNLLVGTATATYTVTQDDYDNDLVYKYVKSNTTGQVGFQKAKVDNVIAVGRAYLKLTQEQASRLAGFADEEGIVTGISSIENAGVDATAPAYNLAGQKVSKSYKGIVIINGKKVVK